MVPEILKTKETKQQQNPKRLDEWGKVEKGRKAERRS